MSSDRLNPEPGSTARLLIVGTGYAGRHLRVAAKRAGYQVSATSRCPDQHLADMDPQDRIRFDLEDAATWPALPPNWPMIWCFPARPLAAVQAFADTRSGTIPRLIVLGSTAAYDLPANQNDHPPRWLDESTAVDHSLPRVQGEEYLRRSHGAIVLRVAGIYGPGRNPLDWIRQGRVGLCDRYVNLIHVDDLAGICLALLRIGTGGDLYNVSDGIPRTWADICRTARERWSVRPKEVHEDQRPGKRICIHKLQNRLNYRFLHPDLFEALSTIEGPPTIDGASV